MAFAGRFLFRSTRQVYAGQSALRSEISVPVRSFAKEAGFVPPAFKARALKGDEELKGIFLDVKKRFEIAIGIFKKEKITIDPEDPAAVAHYAKVWQTVRKEAGILSVPEKFEYTLKTRTEGIPDARSFLLAVRDINAKSGLGDDLGAEAMMMDALDRVEKELKKPLMRNDKKGMAMLRAEFDKVNQKLGINRDDLPKYEQELELKLAKADLEELKKDMIEAMETQKKREEFKDEEVPDVKTLDIRNFL